MVKRRLILLLGLVLLSDTVSSFEKFVALQENEMTRPNMRIGCKVDKIFLKYALGLADIDPEIFNLSLAAESYYKLNQALGEASVASGQFGRTYALHNLLVQNMCFTTRIFRLIVVAIASDFQDLIGDKLDDLEPEMKDILPELPEGAEGLEATAPELLIILLLKYTVFPILSNVVDNKYFKDFEQVVECTLKENVSLYTFTHSIEQFALSNPPPDCPSLIDIAGVLSHEVPAIPKTFTDTIIQIIAKLRNAFDLHGLNDEETFDVEDLYNTLQPELVEIIKAYEDTVRIKDLKEFLESTGVALPANPSDILEPSDPVLQTIQELTRQLIGDDTPLRDFMEYLKGNSTMPELFLAIYDTE